MSPDDTTKISSEQGDPGALNGNIRSRSHGHSDISLSQSRGVIDAVAGHSHRVALCLQLFDPAVLLLREHSRLDFVDAQLFPDRSSRILVVPGPFSTWLPRWPD